MEMVSALVALKDLMERLVFRAGQLDLSLDKDWPILVRLTKEIARTARKIRQLGEIEARAALKQRMLANYGWRWRIISQIGGYSALDRWSRARLRREDLATIAAPIRSAPPKNSGQKLAPKMAPKDVTRFAPRFAQRFAPRLAMTDESGLFRLAPLTRRRHETSLMSVRKICPAARIFGMRKRIKPIYVTAQELDLRTPRQPACAEDAPRTATSAADEKPACAQNIHPSDIKKEPP